MAKSAAQKSPDAYRSIGEVSSEMGLQTHVLRYWEGKFPRHIKPVKRRDGRRMFRPNDMSALRAIQILVHQRGMTLKGAKGLLDEQGVDAVLSGQATVTVAAPEALPVESPARALQDSVADAFGAASAYEDATGTRERLHSVLSDMTDLKRRLDASRQQQAA